MGIITVNECLFPTYLVDYSRLSGGVEDLCGETRQPSGKVTVCGGGFGKVYDGIIGEQPSTIHKVI